MPIITRLLLGLLLLAIPAYAYFMFNRAPLRKLALAVARMLLQLSVLGGCLWVVYHYDSPWLTALWIVAMTLVVATATCQRVRLPRRLVPWVAAGIGGGIVLPLLYLLLVVIRPELPASARWLVPLTGVLLAHVLLTNTTSLGTFYRKIKEEQTRYEELLGNGLKRRHALAPFIGEALLSMARPAVVYLSAMGLLTMPMLLSGLLLGGASPVDAVLLTVLLVVAAQTAAVASLLLTLWATDRQVFDRRGNLRGDVLEG